MARTVAAEMALPPPPEIARRVRAAFAYAGEDVSKEHPKLDISKHTVARIVSGTNPRGADTDELEKIADFTKVPLEFLREGFTGEQPGVPDRLEALEHQYTALRSELHKEVQVLRDERVELAANIRRLEQALAANTRMGRRRQGPAANG
jgi:transcriptional regulator with XRE-family HTH domain